MQRVEQWFEQGTRLHRQGQWAQAKSMYEAVLAQQPAHADALHLLGVIAFQTGHPLVAVTLMNKAIALQPTNPVFHANCANGYKALGRLDDALQRYDQAIALQPRYVEAYCNRGVVLRQLHRYEQALESYDQALALDPKYVEAYANRGVVLQALGRLQEALESFDQAIALKPDHVAAYINRGGVLRAMNRFEDAIHTYDQALLIQPHHAQVHYNRGVALQSVHRLVDAIDSYDQAIAGQPTYTSAHYNRGVALQALLRCHEAIESYDHAIALEPQHVDAHLNKSIACLLLGHYEQGWPLHEWRWRHPTQGLRARAFAAPLWLGREDVRGKTILLHAEQGLGDTIQFCRYAPLVQALGARVVLEVPASLRSLLTTLNGADVLLTQGEPLPDVDFHCPLMSLPLAFNTRLETIPFAEAYLQADAVKVKAWYQRLGPSTNFKIGVVWSGGFRADQPALWDVHERRNISLDVFASSLQCEGALVVGLQKGDPAESTIRGQETVYWPSGNFYNAADALMDFSDTAALIMNLDVVIAVDTSTAHLAAALGKPTWVLTRYDTCWRWLLEREDSPWYRSVRLYRQGSDRQWRRVLEQVAEDLRQLMSARPSGENASAPQKD